MAWCLVKHRDNFTFTFLKTVNVLSLSLSLYSFSSFFKSFVNDMSYISYITLIQWLFILFSFVFFTNVWKQHFLRPLLEFTKFDHQSNADIGKVMQVQNTVENIRIRKTGEKVLKGCRKTECQS
jgi:hypothetical protein